MFALPQTRTLLSIAYQRNISNSAWWASCSSGLVSPFHAVSTASAYGYQSGRPPTTGLDRSSDATLHTSSYRIRFKDLYSLKAGRWKIVKFHWNRRMWGRSFGTQLQHSAYGRAVGSRRRTR